MPEILSRHIIKDKILLSLSESYKCGDIHHNEYFGSAITLSQRIVYTIYYAFVEQLLNCLVFISFVDDTDELFLLFNFIAFKINKQNAIFHITAM